MKIPTCTLHISKNILNFGLPLAPGCVSDPQARRHANFRKSVLGPPRSGSAFGHWVGGREREIYIIIISINIIIIFIYLKKN